MLDTRALFAEAWEAELAKRGAESPSFRPEDYVATGRAKAPYGKKTLDYWRNEGHTLVDNWVEWRKRTRWNVWEAPDGQSGIELALNFVLPGDILVKAFIDRVFVLPSGELGVVDLKTGRTPETSEQLGLYATGIEITYGEMYRPRWGYFWDANKGEHVGPFDLSMWTPRLFSAMYSNAIRGINAGSFLPRPANNCKDWCGVARFCSVVGGVEAPGNDPLLSA